MSGNPVGLVEFLLARLGERQEDAEQAAANGYPDWQAHELHDWLIEGRLCPVQRHEANMIAAHDPAYVLADIKAKRRLIERFRPKTQPAGTVATISTLQGVLRDVPITYVTDLGDDAVLRLLAAPFSSHPDWQPEWSTE